MLASLLLGVAFAHPDSKLVMNKAWLEEITYDFENLDHRANFRHWAETFGKKYHTIEEETERFGVFMKNWERINQHNIAAEEPFTLRLNQFGDLEGDDFRQYVHGHTGSCLRHRTVQERIDMVEEGPSPLDVPSAIDWTDVKGKSYVTPVKNQGQCGSCWSFSTTGAIESAIAIKDGVTGSDIVSLSEQQLVDCSGSYGNLGCDGGLMDSAFEYVIASGGLCTEEEYPYTATDGTCQSETCGKKYDQISSYSDVRADSEESLMSAIAKGPVSIAIEADQFAFQFYSGGVLTAECGDRLDHGVLVVGYGEEEGKKFWKVKNSWGESWGDEGYILLCRECGANDGGGECGILESASYPKA